MKRLLVFALGTLLLAPASFGILDVNTNGLSDLWEKQFNNGELFDANFDPAADPDSDGWTNEQEAAAGTNPFEANPPDGIIKPDIAFIPSVWSEPDENGNQTVISPEVVTVTWPTLVGKQYTLLFSPDLSDGSWIQISIPFIGSGSEVTYGFQIYGSDTRFWRVAVTDADTDGDTLTDAEENQLGSSPSSADGDGDGLSDIDELFVYHTNPIARDSDTDGLPDDWEILHAFDPNDDGTTNPDNGQNGDADGDELFNLWEYWYDTDPHNPDTDADELTDYEEVFVTYTSPTLIDSDGDGISDSQEDLDRDGLSNLDELRIHHTDPQNADTDGDGLRDGWEITNGLDPLIYNSITDPDGDGLSNVQEQRLGLGPLDSDTDDDGMPDGEEDPDGDGLTNLTELNTHHTDPLRADTDSDGLSDSAELNTHLTDPTKYDTDGDGMPDGWEIQHGLDPKSATGLNGTAGDPDNDGLDNFHEWLNGCDPHDADSDNDGVNDLTEVTQGSDPADPGDGGSLPEDEIQEVDFKAYGDYASWRMEIRGEGPRDHRTQFVVTPAVGVPETGTIKLHRNNKYKVTLHHTGSKDDPRAPWYCWEARVDDNPWQQTFHDYEPERIPGVAMFFTIGDGRWLVDNRDGLFTAHNHRTEDDGGNASLGLEATLLPVELISDLNNDGQITAADNPLRDAALAGGATDEIKDKGTEFIFHNDTLSNGIWDKEDTTTPGKPADADDDDAEPILINISSLPDQTQVWLEHPASAGLKYYRDRKCTQEIPLSSSQRHIVGGSVAWPNDNKLFMRADVDSALTYPPANPQFEGDLVLKIKVDTNGQEIEAVKLKLTVVKQLGAIKYFHAARDYMIENNSRLCIKKEAVGSTADPSYKRIISMLHEKTEMLTVDSFHRNPKLFGIDAVTAEFPSYDVAINGNFCYSSDPTWWSSNRPSKNTMTDKCHGRLITAGVVQPCSSTGGPSIYESVIADFIGWNSTSGIQIQTGVVPSSPLVYTEALGGFGSNLAEEGGWHPWFGIANAGNKKVFFTATPFTVDGNGAGGRVDLRQRLANSGCPTLPAGQPGEIQCIYGDGGSSLGLAYKISNSAFMTKLKGSKHIYSTGVIPQVGDYFINTYLLFKSTNPR